MSSTPFIAGNVPIQMTAIGQITKFDMDDNLASVLITDYRGNEFMIPIQCRVIYGDVAENYRAGDYVIVLLHATYSIVDQTIDSPMIDLPKYIIGKYRMPMISRTRARTSTTAQVDAKRYLHDTVESGMLLHDDGGVEIFAEGPIHVGMYPGGHGTRRNAKVDQAENFHRILAGDGSLHLSREHFGSYLGKDDNDMVANAGERKTVCRKFVNADSELKRFTSVCEGTFAPFVGANNDTSIVKQGKESAYYRIVQNGTIRATVDIGDKGAGFYTVRLDKVITDEKPIPMTGHAMPAILGNLSAIQLGEDGSVEVCGGGSGLPAGNMHGFKLSYKPGSGLTIQCKEAIAFTHGDNDKGINSLVLDPAKGVDIKASAGFRVNGKYMASEALVDWIDKNSATFCLATSPGAPAPIHPKALAELQLTKLLDCNMGGYKSDGNNTLGVATTMIIDTDKLKFLSV